MTKIACHECDLLINLPAITEGQRANCPRCNHLLCANPHNGMERSLACAIAGIAFLVLANIFPFLAFQAKGREQVMTLLQSSLDLYRNNSEILAAFVLMFIIIAPTILLCSYIWILGPLVLKGKRAKGPIGSVILFFKPLPGVWQKYF